MKLAERELCYGCGVCAEKCSQSAIQMINDCEGFYYPVVDEFKCNNCGLCAKVCPINNKKKERVEKEAFGAKSIDDKIVNASSSGGIFTEIAKIILNNQGVVVGAAFSDDYKSVSHIIVDSEKDLIKLRGSKYVQSSLLGIYPIVKQLLDGNRIVLFSGTPCQIVALENYLNRKYENLFTLEIICHGVPSPKVFKEYIEFISQKYHSNIKSFCFRYKRNYSPELYYNYCIFDNKKRYLRSVKTDYYGYFFRSDLILRPSCYRCVAKNNETSADLTIGDFWGAEKFCDLKSGNSSLIIVNSNKGKSLLQKITRSIITVKIDYKEAVLKQNKSIVCPAKMPSNRDECMKDFSVSGFAGIVKKYYVISLKERILLLLDSIGLISSLLRIKRIIGKIIHGK